MTLESTPAVSREALNAELFRRPPAPVALDRLVRHVALKESAGQTEAAIARLAAALAHGRITREGDGRSAELLSFEGGLLKWERHTEFTGYTLVLAADPAQPFAPAASTRPAADWLDALPGERLVATQLRVLGPDHHALLTHALMGMDTEAPASLVLDAEARIVMDCRIHPADGYTRGVVVDLGLGAGRRARLVQRLLEIETYRLLALLGFPTAQRLMHELQDLEARLQALVAAVAEADPGEPPEADQRRLHDLLALASELQRHTALDGYRFDASLAYHELVESRLAGLREERLPGHQRLGSFLRRRLTPAMKTVASVRQRLDGLAAEIDHTASLLRTRVELGLQQQNRALLASMDRRAALQLRLQQTLEGLSVVAISYYGIGIVHYLAKAAAALGLPLDASLVAGLAAPLVLLGAWAGVRRARAMIEADRPGE